jgi:hypothetical protein
MNELATIALGRPHAFERGDTLYLTTPVTLAKPTEQQISEYAFATAAKAGAPNENIGWLSGKFVEAGKPNLNGAMWLNDELALKSLTPMLMPITVMHDPRTSVGVIADTKLTGSVIENALAVWTHRYPEVWAEAEHNAQQGSLAQSMECYAPWYSCSVCNQQYVKLPNGAEQSSWCAHLRADDSSSSRGWRTLGDVCFTGTGLIFGSRGGRPAYAEATLDYLHDEIAEAHDRSHHDSTYRPRSAQRMGLVQIEDTELAALRKERDDAKAQVTTLADEKRELTTKVETAEAAKVAAETAKTAADTEVTSLKAAAETASLKDKRIKALGAGFMAKLGDTSKAVLNDLAAKSSDDEWDLALKEREEMAGVKRDAAADGTPPAGTPPANGTPAADGSSFKQEEVAAFMRGTGAAAPPAGQMSGVSAVRKLAQMGRKTPAGAAPGNGNGN